MSEVPDEEWKKKFKEHMEELKRKLEEADQIRDAVKKEMDEMKEKMGEEVPRKGVRVSAPGFRIKIAEDEIEPGVEITTNLAKTIKDSLRRSFAELGEDTLSDIIDEMPEDMASEAMRNVSIPDRVKILKLLYYGPKSYGEIAASFPGEKAKSSLQYHLQQLRNVKLIERSEVSGNYEVTSRGRSLLRLMGIFYGALKGGDLAESGD